MGGFRWVCFCDLDADRPGLGGLEGGWAGMTSSSPELSDSLSDSEIGWSLNGARFNFFNFTSFAGNRVSLNHRKFRSVGELCPKTGIPWTCVYPLATSLALYLPSDFST